MERVLKVSYGYLKFTFSAMLASTILFSLTGLAIDSPRVCLVFIILGIAAFFIGKDELQTRRKHADAHRRHVESMGAMEKTSIEQWAEIAQAALFIASVTAPEPPARFTILVSEWRHKHNHDSASGNVSLEAQSDEAEVSFALQAMNVYRESLQNSGFTLCFISKINTPSFLNIYRNALSKTYKLVHPFPNDSYVPGDSNVVIGFMVLHQFKRNSENKIAEILKDSFELVKEDHAVTKFQ